MNGKTPLGPRKDLPAQLPRIGAEYFSPEALELCRNLKGRQVSDLSDDEILMLALTAAQAALAKHVEPGNKDAEDTLNTILSVLDHHEIVQAEMRKLHRMRNHLTEHPRLEKAFISAINEPRLLF
jgi:hypothetical protein